MATTKKKSDAKVQAKLGFSAVPKDSEQAQQLSASVRERASVVRYYSPKKVGSRNGLANARLQLRHNGRSTQQTLRLEGEERRSSPRHGRSDDHDYEYDSIYGTERHLSPGPSPNLPPARTRRRANSYGLDDLDNALGSETTVTPRKAARQAFISSSPLRPYHRGRCDEHVDNHHIVDDTEDIQQAEVRSSQQPQSLDDEEDNADDDLPSIRRIRVNGSAVVEDDESDEPVLPSSLRRTRLIESRTIDDALDESEDEPVLPSSAMRTSRQLREADHNKGTNTSGTSLQRSSRTTRQSKATQLASSNTAIDVDAESEAVSISSPKRSLRSRVVYLSDSSNEDDEPIVSSSTRASKRFRSLQDDHTQSSSSAKKRRLQQGYKPSHRKRQEQDEEILEDAEDLKNTETISSSLRSSAAINSTKLARQQQLAKLAARRNKTGQRDEAASSSTEPEDLPYPIPFSSLYPDSDASNYETEGSEDSLIDDAPLPNSSNNEEPEALALNRTIFDIPSALYYVIRQLLYYRFLPLSTLDPSDKVNVYYTAADSLIDKRLQSYANQFISSVWRPQFLACLYSRPIMAFPNESVLWPGCEACGRRDRLARYVLRFEGACYDHWTLAAVDKNDCKTWSRFGFTAEEAEGEPDRDPDEYVFMSDLEDDQASQADAARAEPDSNDEDGHLSRDQRRQQRSGKARIWYLGSECLSNAMKAHKALHWRWGVGDQIGKALNAMKIVLDDPELESETETEMQGEQERSNKTLTEQDSDEEVALPRSQSRRSRQQIIIDDDDDDDEEIAPPRSSPPELQSTVVPEPEPEAEAEAEAEAEFHKDDTEKEKRKKQREMEREDHYIAVLSQMEDQEYIQALQVEFMERFDLAGEDDDYDSD